MRVKDGSKNLNCLKSTLRYFGDKGIYLMLINLLPAMLLPFTISPSVTLYYLFDIKKLEITSISQIFEYMWNVSYSFWYIGIIGVVILIFTLAITFGVIDRHMRVGEFTLSPARVKTRLNYNVLTSIRFVVMAAISLQLYNIIATLLYYLWATVCSTFALTMAFTVITLIILETCMIYTMSWFILWPPFMLHTGLRSSSALKSAWGSMAGRLNRTAFSIAVIVLPFQTVMAITAACNLGIVCRTLLDVIAYAVIIPYYVTLMYTTFYDVTGTERMDIITKNNNIWTKK